jgi:pectate lyase
MSKIDVKDVSDVSILGAYPCAEFNGIGIKIWKASNIIIRNLKIHHVLSGEKDCISIEGPADHIWIDHCELFNEYQEVDKDYYDGLLDAKAEAEYLTYSWNYLHDSWKTALVGSSEGDIFDRKLTMHHNYFFNCNSRLPLFRASTGHFFNNYFKDIVSTTINSRINSCVRIEKNYFENAQNPWVSAYSDILGGGDTIDNILVNSPFVYSSDTREMTFCSPDIPYEYQTVLNETSSVPVIVTTFAGVGKIYADTGTTQVFSQPDPLREPFRVYPNPCTGECHLEFLNGNIGIISISMIDITGKRTVLYNNYLHQKMNQVVDIDNHRLSPGIYILEIRSQSETFWKKIICGP